MNSLKIYNTLSRKKEEFTPLNKNSVGMYVCGPTVYDEPHIGNARPLIIFDLVYRVLIKKFGKNKAHQIDTTSKSVSKITKAVINSLKGKFKNDKVDWLTLVSKKNDLKKFFPY